DFSAMGSAVTLAAGESSATVDVLPLIDDLSEGDETVTVEIDEDPAYVGGTTRNATVTIKDLPIAGWRHRVFGTDANNPTMAGDNVDLDGDALSNLMEYALALDPFVPGPFQPTIGMEGTDLTISY